MTAASPLFTCLICGEAVPHPQPFRSKGMRREREPICSWCTRKWGSKNSGPVFNRDNYHALGQLKAMITNLEWEIRNGPRHR